MLSFIWSIVTWPFHLVFGLIGGVFGLVTGLFGMVVGLVAALLSLALPIGIICLIVRLFRRR